MFAFSFWSAFHLRWFYFIWFYLMFKQNDMSFCVKSDFQKDNNEYKICSKRMHEYIWFECAYVSNVSDYTVGTHNICGKRSMFTWIKCHVTATVSPSLQKIFDIMFHIPSILLMLNSRISTVNDYMYYMWYAMLQFEFIYVNWIFSKIVFTWIFLFSISSLFDISYAKRSFVIRY